MKKLDGSGAALTGLIVLVLGVLLIASFGFGMWAFAGKEDARKNTDAKIAAAVEAAKTEVAQEKEAEFAEREKSPLKTYTSPSALGSVSFSFPKTWSALVDESTESGAAKPLDGYLSPNYLPSITDNKLAFALRLELLTQAYDQVTRPFNAQATAGTVRVSAFKPDKVPSALGVKVEGTVLNDKQGVMVVLPLREKTLKIWTESTEFVNDFNNTILPSLSFVP